MQYKSISDLNRTIINGVRKLPRDIDLVVGVPRSGLLAANIISLYLNLPLADFDGFLQGRMLTSGRRLLADKELCKQGKLKVLLVDDSLQSGTQLGRIREIIDEAGLPHEIVYCVVYSGPDGIGKVDIVFEVISKNRIFEWNVFHHSILTKSCIDIDGFLCEDPSPQENDDGENYLNFLEKAPPLFLPTVELGWLVTCRLEKYRRQTEAWLSRHNIRYRQLLMMNFASKAERVASGSHAAFKSSIYAQTGARLFVESSLRQSREIMRLSQKPVFCVETMQLLTVNGEPESTVFADVRDDQKSRFLAKIFRRMTGGRNKR